MSHAEPISRSTWTLIAVLGLNMCLGFGLSLNAFGVYSLAWIESFGCSNEQASRAAGAYFVAMSLTMPLAGWHLARVPPRAMMSLGMAVTSLSCVLAAYAETLGGVIAAMGLCGAGIGLSTYIPSFTLVSARVQAARQGLAFGVLLAAISAGGIIFPPLLERLVALLGWRQTMLSSGLLLGLSAPLLLVTVRGPASPAGADSMAHTHASGDGRSLAQTLNSGHYWLWVVMLALVSLSSIGLLMNLLPLLVKAGYETQRAAQLCALTGLATLVGNLLFGLLSMRCGPWRTLCIGTAISAIATLLLLVADHPQLGLLAMLGFALAWGSCFNTVNLVSPTLLFEAVGPRNFGTLLGLGNLLSGLAAAAGPSALGYLVDRSHSYTLPLLASAAVMAAALLPALGLRKPPQ